MRRVTEIGDPQGGRNMIREGDAVRVAPGRAESCSWRARFLYGEVDESGRLAQVTVFGGKGFDPARPGFEQDGVGSVRTVLPTRLRRMSQAHVRRKAKADA